MRVDIRVVTHRAARSSTAALAVLGLLAVTVVGPPRVQRAVVRAESAPSATSALTATAAPRPIDHVRALAALGPRTPGSAADRKAQEYITRQLKAWGYEVRVQRFRIPDGRRTANVVAIKQGRSRRRILVGAHTDSKSPSPGANDNASGVAVTLDLARRLARADIAPTVVFAFFGAEEIAGRHPSEHHFGSTHYVENMTFADLLYLNGMISVDMVGVGTRLHTRTMGLGRRTLESSLRKRAESLGYRMTYLRDLGRYGWSDHEPFERFGIPVAWLEWRDDPRYHTRGDVASRVSPWRMTVVARTVEEWLRHTSDRQLRALPGW